MPTHFTRKTLFVLTAMGFTLGSEAYAAELNPPCRVDTLDGSSGYNVECGYLNTANISGNNTALGSQNEAYSGFATAVGHHNLATQNSTAVGENNLANFARAATAVGTANVAYGTNSTAVGAVNTVGESVGEALRSSSLGFSNTIRTISGGGDSVAIGSSNFVSGTKSTALGTNNRIGPNSYVQDRSIAIGDNNRVYGNNSTAIGSGSTIGSATNGADYVTVIGTNALATADAGVAIGPNAQSLNYGTIAMGDRAAGSGMRSVALGADSSSTGNNSVALGSGSTDSGQSNVVAVGAVGAERRIINLAAGTAQTDAVNVGQLQNGSFNAALSTLTVGGNTTIGSNDASTVSIGSASGNSTVSFNGNRLQNVGNAVVGSDAVNLNQLNAAISGTNNAINGLQNQMNSAKAGIAGVTAATNLPGLNNGQKYNFGIGWGNYMAYNGMAVGGHARVTDNVTLKVSGSATSGVYSGGAGMAIGF